MFFETRSNVTLTSCPATNAIVENIHVMHRGQGTHICISKLTITGSDNGLSPGWHQAIIWTNAGIFIGPLGTNFSQILIEIQTFSIKKMHLKLPSGKWLTFCLSLNVLKEKATSKQTEAIISICYDNNILYLLLTNHSNNTPDSS